MAIIRRKNLNAGAAGRGDVRFGGELRKSYTNIYRRSGLMPEYAEPHILAGGEIQNGMTFIE
jgi:hypothetical protein